MAAPPRFTAMTADRIPGGLRLCRACGWNQLEEDWRFFLDAPGSGGVVSERAGNILGTAAWIRYGALAWIAMMLVDPAERGAGVGAGLLAEALSSVAHVPCVGLDATPAGEPLYRRFGFEAHSSVIRTKAVVDGALLPGPSGAVRRMVEADLPDIYHWDRKVFGADRSLLLAALFARAPECAWVVGGAARLRGYTFGRPGHLYYQLGPVVAADAATARELAAGCLSRLHGRKVAIDAGAARGEFLGFLQSAGFVEERCFARMYLRGCVPPGVPSAQYAIAGPEFG
ncbi:MAG: GNAT family N-acetyltransferase [Candidatus Sulfopaludibacter sp.]|nr:GNAT family N-acetyltransferase [Candidatus Sulfopaludibacter sp.]